MEDISGNIIIKCLKLPSGPFLLTISVDSYDLKTFKT